MKALRLVLWIAFWIISYVYLQNMEYNQQKDINRRDFCLKMINLVCWVIGMYLMFFVGFLLCRGFLLRNEGDEFMIMLSIMNLCTLYFAISFLKLFYEGLYINSDLTQE